MYRAARHSGSLLTNVSVNLRAVNQIYDVEVRILLVCTSREEGRRLHARRAQHGEYKVERRSSEGQAMNFKKSQVETLRVGSNSGLLDSCRPRGNEILVLNGPQKGVPSLTENPNFSLSQIGGSLRGE